MVDAVPGREASLSLRPPGGDAGDLAGTARPGVRCPSGPAGFSLGCPELVYVPFPATPPFSKQMCADPCLAAPGAQRETCSRDSWMWKPGNSGR